MFWRLKKAFVLDDNAKSFLAEQGYVIPYFKMCIRDSVMIADTVKTVKCMDSSKLWYVEKQAEFMNELRNGRCVGLVKKIKDTFRR